MNVIEEIALMRKTLKIVSPIKNGHVNNFFGDDPVEIAVKNQQLGALTLTEYIQNYGMKDLLE